MAVKYLISIILVLQLSGCYFIDDSPIVGTVSFVTDGDTFVMETFDDFKVIKVRLKGIDCPERNQAWGPQAKSGLINLIEGKPIKVLPSGNDRYGRMVGVVYFEDLNVNRYLVQTGHCWPYFKYLDDDQLLVLHKEAKSKKVGLFSMNDDEIIEPWKYRNN